MLTHAIDGGPSSDYGQRITRAEDIAQVRRFNRLVTQRVGALDGRYLARDRPLGEARLLWEIGPDGADVKALRARLDLDSGYLSRLLRSLETAGLVTVGTATPDRRIRTASLTARGRRERALLDRLSDELAASLLEPLNERQRTRLTAAMGEVERLLTAAMVEVAPADPKDPRAQHCLAAYAAELDARFADGFDAARSIPLGEDELDEPRGVLLLATLHQEPVGCGALRFHDGAPTELKRMWVSPEARGLGVGRRLLQELEARAAERHPVVHLETNGSLTEAIAMYRAAGYEEVAPFSDEAYAHHWFRKRLRATPTSTTARAPRARPGSRTRPP
jgi:DNA-binding MarR family transcriptional regulator/GNAT superfamily N-acetyltransferase